MYSDSSKKTHWSSKTMPATDAWAEQFHVWAMEWGPDKLTLLLDGKEMNSISVSAAGGHGIPNPFQQKVFIIVNQALGGANGGDPSKTKFPLDYLVDYVRVYQGTPAPPSPSPAPSPVKCMAQCEQDAKQQAGCCEIDGGSCSWHAKAHVEGGQSKKGAQAANCHDTGACDGWNANEKCS